MRILWPDDPIPDLVGLPFVDAYVTTPRDQAVLHRQFARLGYVPELLESRAGVDVYRFVHPDGEKP